MWRVQSSNSPDCLPQAKHCPRLGGASGYSADMPDSALGELLGCGLLDAIDSGVWWTFLNEKRNFCLYLDAKSCFAFWRWEVRFRKPEKGDQNVQASLGCLSQTLSQQTKHSWTWSMPIILAHVKLRQEDCCEPGASLGYTVSSLGQLRIHSKIMPQSKRPNYKQ